MKKIYIAGKISGENQPDCHAKFNAIEKKLKHEGYSVINPLSLINNWQISWPSAMKQCIAALMECDAIYMIGDWCESPGARLELNIATALDMEIIHEI